ncbi:MAG: DUF1343 domain-containing protein [Limnochordaceae bacterium]|nr:DUF1343 domain-containing protein [Limnochordaceae bacterium]
MGYLPVSFRSAANRRRPPHVHQRKLACGPLLLLGTVAASLVLTVVAGVHHPAHLGLSLASTVTVRAAETSPGTSLRLGIDRLLGDQFSLIAGKRVGLITNQTGRGRDGQHDADRLAADKRVQLVALFSPEHGFRGDEPPGAYVASYVDPVLHLPVYSLYGPTQRPTAAMLRGIDVLLFDIQDVGSRYYTYISTMAYALQAAAQYQIPIIVLDRPNPIGGQQVEGPVLEPAYQSFVGLYPIPVRHGMTIGELARLFNEEFGIHAPLTVVPMEGWTRSTWWDQTGLPWVKPSPNMTSPQTALVYPGTCLLEGTNVSEGRGTARPFETLGAPWIDGTRLANALNALRLPGVRFEPVRFVPTTSKYQGEACEGVQLEVTDRLGFASVRTGLWIIATIERLYPQQFRFNQSAGQYYFDTLIGNGRIRPALQRGENPDTILAPFQAAVDRFIAVRSRYLLYP